MDGKYCSLSSVLSLWNNVRICRYSSYKWNQGSDTFNPVWHHLLWIASHNSTLLLLSKESILSLRVVKKLEKGFIDTSFNDKHHRFAWELKLFGFLALRSFIKDTTTSITTKKQIQDYFLRKKEKGMMWFLHTCELCSGGTESVVSLFLSSCLKSVIPRTFTEKQTSFCTINLAVTAKILVRGDVWRMVKVRLWEWFLVFNLEERIQVPSM